MRKTSYRWEINAKENTVAILANKIFPISFIETTDFRFYKFTNIQTRHNNKTVKNRSIIDAIWKLHHRLPLSYYLHKFYKDNLIILVSNQKAKDFYQLCYKR